MTSEETQEPGRTCGTPPPPSQQQQQQQTPDYKALYFELIETMESIGLNIAIQAKNQKNQIKAHERRGNEVQPTNSNSITS